MNIAQRQAQADAALAISLAQADLINRLEAQVAHLEEQLLKVALDDVRQMRSDITSLIALFRG